MSNLSEYKEIIDPILHKRIFINDPTLNKSHIYINRKFSATIQQLFLLRHWQRLNKKISSDELWLLLRAHEYRSSKLLFDGNTGIILADSVSQKLFKTYYYNSFWFDETDNVLNYKKLLNFSTVLLVIVCLIIFYYILSIFQQNHTSSEEKLNILNILETSTRAQQWRM